ncbi:hypothetical protein S40293_11137 [Stachybotrys chartarum IBT 40293]|nr:hypothetical protein S40293_11137 [Stachybotrys chartarum IBT 40293]
MPDILPAQTPLPRGNRHYFLGRGILEIPGRLVGQGEIADAISNSLEDTSHRHHFICLSGVGGIGKTELAYKVVTKYKNKQPVFVFHASSPTTLEASFTNLMFEIGHNALIHRYPDFQNAVTIWQSLDHPDRVAAVEKWLRSDENVDAVFVLDDADGLGDLQALQEAFGHMGPRLVITCRDPTLLENMDPNQFPIRDLNGQDALALIQRQLTTKRIPASEAQLQRLMDITLKHPLLIHMSISYIDHFIRFLQPNETLVEHFLVKMAAHDWLTRESLIRLELSGLQTLAHSFERSLERLPDGSLDKVLPIIESVAFVSTPFSPIDLMALSPLFRRRCRPDPEFGAEDLPDWETLTSPLETSHQWLFAMKRTSLLVADDGGAYYFHPVWLECARHRCAPDRRKSWLKQLIVVCFVDWQADSKETAGMFLSHVLRHRQQLCVGLEELGLSQSLIDWVNDRTSTFGSAVMAIA